MCKRKKGQLFFRRILPFALLICAVPSCISSRAVADPSAPVAISYSSAELFKEAPFIAHTGNQNMQNYLALNIDFAEVEQIRKQVEKQITFPLKNRGEAHITVISPIEFGKSSTAKSVGMNAINKVALKYGIQQLRYLPVCVGRGEKLNTQTGETMQTYFLVVDSLDLVQLREKVKEELKLTDWDLQNFYPHITLGFTERDLHFEEGVVKNKESCLIPLIAQKRLQ